MLNVISWNIDGFTTATFGKNISVKKQLTSGKIISEQINVKTFITNVLTGNRATTAPADIIVIIEMAGGGGNVGSVAAGPKETLAQLKAAINLTLDLQGVYKVVSSPSVGEGEAMGIIYNSNKLEFNNLAGTTVTPVGGKAVFWCNLVPLAPSGINGNITSLNIVGIHAPKVNTGKTLDTINYCLALNGVSQVKDVKVANKEGSAVLGDFNISPRSKVDNKSAYDSLSALKYKTRFTATSKTTIKDPSTITTTNDYLGNPFDNIFSLLPSGVTNNASTVIDLVANTVLRPTILKDVKFAVTQLRGSGVSNRGNVSDHLPVLATIS